jgi:anti-sigma factor RsiW
MLRRDRLGELSALADGQLSGRRRAEVEARVEGDRHAQELLAQQRRALAALGAFREAAPVAAPAGLRQRVERLQTEAAQRTGLRLGLRPLLAGAVAATAAVILVLLLPMSNAPSVDAVAAIVHREAVTSSVPASTTPGLLRHSFAGVTFPDWAKEFGWRAIGARRDEIEGRKTGTVFYFHQGHRIAYTVVEGDPLALPSRARRVSGVPVMVHLTKDSKGHDVAVFERGGHTCVLGGHVLRQSTLVKLASWPASGNVNF